MRIYTILPIKTIETGHFVIDEASKPAHKEILSSIPIYIIEEKAGSFFLNNYDENGTWIGDTWHPNIQEAKHQAEFEYGNLIDNWKEIPQNIEDPIKYVFEEYKNGYMIIELRQAQLPFSVRVEWVE